MKVKYLFAFIIALFPLIINAQNYDSLWKEFDENISKRLPESAAKVLDDIEKQAVKDKNDVQLLKVIINRCDVISMTSEAPSDSIISYCKAKLPELSAASQVILQVEIAKANRTHLHDVREELIESQYVAAIEKAKELGNHSMADYVTLYDKENIKYDLDLEPTLYDFAMHNILDYIDISSLARNYVFDYSVSNDVFHKYNDYYKQLIDFDLSNNYIKAANFNKIHQIEDLAIYFNDSKHNLKYFNELDSLATKCDDKITIGRIKASQANIMMREENYVEALKLCDEVIALNIKSGSTTKCKECKKEILKKYVLVEKQNEQIPHQSIPVGLTYKNTTNPSYRIYKINADDIKNFNGKQTEEIINSLVFNEIVDEKTLQIPVETDYKKHSSLIAIPPLEVGTYLLVFSPTDEFDDLESLFVCGFQVSNLTYAINSFKDKTEIYTLDRTTGQPVGGVTVEITTDSYNYNKRKYIKKTIASVVSDKNGCAILPQNVEKGKVNLYYGTDTILYNDNYVFNYLTSYNSTNKIQLYTDRPIYRPGQTVLFKGISYQSNNMEYDLICDDSLEVSLMDASGQIIETKSFTTDEYGAFSGSFVLPKDRLSGTYKVSTKNGNAYFNVEEYKRPTFEVTFNGIQKEFAINDNVSVSGNVQSFAGFGMDNVNYEYTVTRQTAFPCRLWWFIPRPVADRQIFSGKGITSNDGSFNIDFQLLPDGDVKIRELPLYTYVVNVKATNVQGETREAKYYINASYNKYNLSLDIENQFVSDGTSSLTPDNLKNCKISVSNIAGEKTTTDIECKIYRLPENKKFEKHICDFDRQILDDEELETLFPNFDYYNKKSQNINGYDLVYNCVIKAEEKPLLITENIDFTAGRYIIELKSVDDTLSQFTEEFVLFNPKSKKMPYKSIGWSVIDKTTAQPGDIVNFSFGSSEKDVMAFLIVDNGSKVYQTERILLNNNVKTISFKVNDEDRGRLNFNVAFEKLNEFFDVNYTVDVPYDNLKLNVKLETERDVLSPGGEETWKVKISDYTKKGTPSSLLAGMYDASLNSVSQFFHKIDWNLDVIPHSYCGTRLMIDNNYISTINRYYNYNNVYYFNFNYGDLFSNSNLLKFNIYYNGRKVTNLMYVSDEALGYEEELVQAEIYKIADPVDLDENANDKTNVKKNDIQIRSNFNETAFFYPNLKTDENGDATFTFTMPDALTRWKLRMLAYTKDLKVGTLEKTFVTQKPVMIMADMPRFCYDEDTLWLVANVVNLSEEAISPVARLEVFDESGELRVESGVVLSEKEIKMKEIPAGRSQSVRWKVAMKKDVNLLTFRFSATAGDFSDAEQHIMPVLSTDVFMTQTFSLIAKGNEKKNYNFNFENEGERNHAIMLNFSKNPTWYAVQALPYLNNDNEKYAETAFHRYFTNSVARHIAASLKNSPEMKKLLESLNDDSSNNAKSELEKNQELKEILLNETPWVVDAKNEAEQRANISKLFDTKAIDKNIESALKILKKKQKPSGGWPWVEGMPESAYVTQYILGGLGRLEGLEIRDERLEIRELESQISEKAFHFIENDVVKRFSDLKESDRKDYHCSVMIVRELFVMSYFPKFETSGKFNEAKAFYIGKLKNDWTSFNFKAQAGIALILNRNGDKTEAMAILKSLRECAQKNNLGMYWVGVGVEDEARILEAFNEIDPKNEEIDAMRFWILGQKRTNMWDNDRATAEAVYAIVNRGTDWVNDNGEVVIEINGKRLEIRDEADNFIQQSLPVDGDYSNVSIDNQTNHQVWGGMFRQYFVPIDKVQKSNEDMKLRREFFVERIEGDKTKYVPVSEEDIRVGDKIKIVLHIENQQDMEFVYLKDLRGACFEPTEQISRYHYSDGLWYYQSTSDVAMEFFFDNMPKGKHELSHTVYVTKEGSFSAGYAVVQCQYAPEFGAYSEGRRIVIK
ncbi:MAG: MG2 domain-containing protein [Bacteroidales bacterium]|nr:MG2 domain-containing protein [Bacteroidales bacterium]